MTVGFAEVLLLNPVIGDHEYVLPDTGAAPIVPEIPEHTVISAPAFETGAAVVDTTTEFVEAHNVVVFVTVTVYVPPANPVAVWVV